eukprot:2862954-Prymnesium_polylepis.1
MYPRTGTKRAAACTGSAPASWHHTTRPWRTSCNRGSRRRSTGRATCAREESEVSDLVSAQRATRISGTRHRANRGPTQDKTGTPMTVYG